MSKPIDLKTVKIFEPLKKKPEVLGHREYSNLNPEMVYDIFKDIFKDKKIEMIETSHINYGGGNIHCVTMNVPKNVN